MANAVRLCRNNLQLTHIMSTCNALALRRTRQLSACLQCKDTRQQQLVDVWVKCHGYRPVIGSQTGGDGHAYRRTLSILWITSRLVSVTNGHGRNRCIAIAAS